MTLMLQMAEFRRMAARANCRVKAFKLSDNDAWRLAGEIVAGEGDAKLASIALNYRCRLFAAMLAGDARFQDAAIVVVQ